jgi:acyl-CoA synthetase (NDP forming)
MRGWNASGTARRKSSATSSAATCFVRWEPVSSGVAIISQSSNIALNLTMQARGLPIAYIMTVGNQAQSGLSHIGEALLDDDRVTAIGLHIEGIDDLPVL